MRAFFSLISGVALLAGCSGGEESQTERQAALVRAAPVSTHRFVERIEAVGTARANEQVTISAPVTERIVRLNFDSGGYVERGQVIAVLAQGQESAQLNEAQAQAREAAQQLERLEALKARGFATNSAVDAQTAAASIARAQAAQASASIGDRVIRAPFSGFVSLRTISAGAVVQAGTEIATVSDINPIKLDFAVPETLLAAISEGQPIFARASAYPDLPFRGEIETIDAVVNPQTRAVTVRAILPNPEAKLKPGMLLTVVIEADARSALAVPELSVVAEGDRNFVYAVDDGVARRVAVDTGLRQNGLVEIIGGLSAGQRVVTDGVVKLADGQAVRLAGPQNSQPRTAKSAP